MYDRPVRCTLPRVSRLVPALALALAACGPYEPDMYVEVNWQIGNGVSGRCDLAAVDTVTLDFLTGGLEGAEVPCTDAVAILVRSVPLGTYRVRVQGLDQGVVVFGGEFVIEHVSAGDHRYSVDVPPAFTEIEAFFTFAGFGNQNGMTCAEAGVSRVDITVGSQSFNNVPCSAGGVDGTVLQNLTPGTVTLVARGYDAAGTKLYESEFRNLVVNQGSNQYTLNLLGAVNGGLQLSWVFSPQRWSCATAAVSTVQFEIARPNGNSLGLQTAACGSQPATYNSLEAGVYTLVKMSGFSGTTETYRSVNQRLYVPAGKVQGWEITLGQL